MFPAIDSLLSIVASHSCTITILFSALLPAKDRSFDFFLSHRSHEFHRSTQKIINMIADSFSLTNFIDEN
jgi:hypothetical protein